MLAGTRATALAPLLGSRTGGADELEVELERPHLLGRHLPGVQVAHAAGTTS